MRFELGNSLESLSPLLSIFYGYYLVIILEHKEWCFFLRLGILLGSYYRNCVHCRISFYNGYIFRKKGIVIRKKCTLIIVTIEWNISLPESFKRALLKLS